MTPGQDQDERNHFCHVLGCADWGCFGKDKVWGCRDHLPPGWTPGVQKPAEPARAVIEPPKQGGLF